MTRKNRCIILGSGGHARAVVAAAIADATLDIAGILDEVRGSVGEDIGGVLITGTFDDLQRFREQGIDHALLAIGDNGKRRAAHLLCKELGFNLPVVCHPSAVVEPTASLDEGTYVGAMAYVGVLARIGAGVIVNTGTSVDHESRVGDYASLAPGVIVAGRTQIGQSAFLGMGCKLADGLTIGDRARIGAGSVVLSDVPAGEFVTGAPAKPRSGK